jgi:5-methylcytosine-specific restriction endonuclease McrA
MGILNKKTLLLNSSYEPLGTVDAQRAICMQINEHVYVEEVYDKTIRSQKAEWKIPSVVRLKKYIDVRKRRKKSAAKRARIFMRDKHRCVYCGKKFHESGLTLDHVHPKSRGGLATPENLVTSCMTCNQLKGDRTPEEARMPLLNNNRKIPLDGAVMIHYSDENPSWKKYLFYSDEGDATNYEVT